MDTLVTYDYSREVEVLKCYFHPGSPPIGDRWWWEQPTEEETAYLGEVECSLYIDTWIDRLSPDPAIQGLLRETALGEEDAYSEWYDKIEIGHREVETGVEVPFNSLHPVDQAFFRLVAFLGNSQS